MPKGVPTPKPRSSHVTGTKERGLAAWPPARSKPSSLAPHCTTLFELRIDASRGLVPEEWRWSPGGAAHGAGVGAEPIHFVNTLSRMHYDQHPVLGFVRASKKVVLPNDDCRTSTMAQAQVVREGANTRESTSRLGLHADEFELLEANSDPTLHGGEPKFHSWKSQKMNLADGLSED